MFEPASVRTLLHLSRDGEQPGPGAPSSAPSSSPPDTPASRRSSRVQLEPIPAETRAARVAGREGEAAAGGPADSEASTAASSGVPGSEAGAVPAYGAEVEKALEAARTWRQDLEQARREFAAKLAREYGVDPDLAAEEADAPPPEAAPDDDADAVTAPAGDDVDALLQGNDSALAALRARRWPSEEAGGAGGPAEPAAGISTAALAANLNKLEFDLARLRADSAALFTNHTTSARSLDPVDAEQPPEAPSAGPAPKDSVGGLAEELAALCADVDTVVPGSPQGDVQVTPYTAQLLAQCDALLEDCDALLAEP